MFREAAEAPGVVSRQLAANRKIVEALARRLRERPPRAVVTCARGSSDHAATFARYLIETRLGVVTASAAPSVSSIYEVAPSMDGMLCLAISQSGRSPDLLAWSRAAAETGGFVLALVNDADSPLARQADLTLPLHAGSELSVAATKSYIASLSVVCQLTAAWSEDAELSRALEKLPALLDRAWTLPWDAALPMLRDARGLYVIGRGLGFGVAQEAALKLKETSGLHAEAFSSAEVRHGPMALVGPGFPILALAQDDESRSDIETAVQSCVEQVAQVMMAGRRELSGVTLLPTEPGHAALQPIAMIQSFYRLAAQLSVARGLDPDRPPNLAKVTETR
jgi:glucosamine--fructose-6-phosphate aminotransferase (isomerizing)